MVLETEESRPGDPWENLPLEFLIKVLRDHGRPVSALVACRLVFKRWMEIVDGPDLRNKIWNGHVPVFYDNDGKAYFCEVHDFLRFLGNLRRDVRDQFLQ
ncbi:hypothetical protein MPTK1_4g18700 [Marchantia polymorpha subsp. ruderalis]|uniref:F-box domain-containing protein n=2 Tax=Marchantia polymorpha TaxID=3197 RepID=A0AAF6BBC5_MARPO|nr:hypothetical protein MARPO_0041s0152 [Marchantia polymorpha]BBN09309.1 hypothetical protein Mp_4g18700 [Marchantia polymorpha subsp. ruderalis]|eukprot:PTQ40300.1 hypothetical protein MARPO_0041s0152 [Marchantia polymorpha]